MAASVEISDGEGLHLLSSSPASTSSAFSNECWICSSCTFSNGQTNSLCSSCGSSFADTPKIVADHGASPNLPRGPQKNVQSQNKVHCNKLRITSPQQPNNPANSSDQDGSGSLSPSSSNGSGVVATHDLGPLDLSAGHIPHRRDPRLGPNADEDERRATEEGRKVFVGNLKRPITRNEVIEHFSKFGEVERVILNSGFGLVLMTTREGALKATAERWQALDWRNVEVFIYQKGAKGASWNRPYALPPRPGPCSRCGKESAEHCTLCTSALCLNDVGTCTACCRTCQRSFCFGDAKCGGLKDGLDTCDTCGALTCLFCALRLEATCNQCGSPFSDRLREVARHRAVKLVNFRIADNDGSVYALVCLLKGDVESSREGQLVAAIDRAAKLFDPQASSWCTLTALRAIKELDEAWEATRRVHNLRALRRSAKQWSTDLAVLAMPHHPQPNQSTVLPPPLGVHHGHPHQSPHGAGSRHAPHHHPQQQQQQQQQHRHPMHHSNGSSMMMRTAPTGPIYGVQHSPQQQQQPGAAQPFARSMVNEEVLLGALRSCEAFFSELEPRPMNESDWLIANLRNTAFSATKKKNRFIDELASRMQAWAVLLRRFGPESEKFFVTPSTSLMAPLNKLKRAVVDLDTFYTQCTTKEEFLLRKDAFLLEVLKSMRELKRSSPPFTAADLLLKRAGRSMRNVEMRALFVVQGMLPFEACVHHCRYRKCSLHVGVLGKSCPFAHYSFGSMMDDEDSSNLEFQLADYEFSNDPDDISLTVASSSIVHPPVGPPGVLAPNAQQMNNSIWGVSPIPTATPPAAAITSARMGWSKPSASIPMTSQSMIMSSLDPFAASIAKTTTGEMQVASTPLVRRNESVPFDGEMWNKPSQQVPRVEFESSSALEDDIESLILPSLLDTFSPSGGSVEPPAIVPFKQPDIVLQVADLCNELGLESPVLLAQITAAFFASGAANHAHIWNTDLALLYKALLKVPNFPAAMRVKMLNLISERRGNNILAAPSLGVSSLVVPPLL